MSQPSWINNLAAIGILLGAIALVLWRIPKVDLGHSSAFKQRRFWNWFPLGLTYAFLYMGRYNLNGATSALGKLTPNAAFGTIFAWGTVTYGLSFLLNGPLADRWGGRATILLSAGGAAVCNALMGMVVYAVLNHGWVPPGGLVTTLAVLYSVNMYFQSFGAVSIVKVNSGWFHTRERGLLGALFGILISLGIYFAYDLTPRIIAASTVWAAFFAPAVLLAGFFLIDLFVIRDHPSQTGHPDFDAGDASSGDTGPRLGVFEVAKKMLTNRVILIIVAVEFCSGFLRQAVMQWYPKYAKAVGIAGEFVPSNFGLLLCVAGILGGMFAGVISDKVFDSRRGPVSAVLYGGLALGAGAAIFTLGTPALGWVMIFMSLCVIGVHGMLSGTASMDFGGKKNAGVAVGIIDGFVYLGTAFQSFLYARVLPGPGADKVTANWSGWVYAIVPMALIGFVLATRVWHARPQPKVSPAPVPLPSPASDQGRARKVG
jgi:OPA family glycerol-3-phosphate transporter-like MFS transporter